MKSLLHQFCEQRTTEGIPGQLLKAICQASEDELRDCFSRATTDEQQAVAIRGSDCIRYYKSRSVLITGMVIHLFVLATPEKSRNEQTAIMAKEIGLRRSHQYRCRDAFVRFGRELLVDPKLSSRFVASAILKLSQRYVPETASYEARKRARAGEIINIDVAKAIIAAHCPIQPSKPVTEATSTRVSPPSVNRSELMPTDSDVEATIKEGVEERRLEIDARKTPKDFRQGQLVYQDNIARVFVLSVNSKSEPTPEAIHYAIQQAYRKLCDSNPVQAIVADTLEPSC